MVSATDIITYIGVPLAVLGVMPILYTFVLALYTRLKLQRILRRNQLEAQVRARLMTGVVEVDLPIYELEPRPRDDERYWSVLKPKPLGGASWSCFDWFQREAGRVTLRIQRSDKVILPEAKIDFSKLLAFLQDRGAVPCPGGFHALRQRGPQSALGTTLMELVPQDDLGPNETPKHPVLSFVKLGEQHGSISLKVNWVPWIGLPLSRTFNDLPVSCISGLLGQTQPETRFVIVIGATGIEEVDIKSNSNLNMADILEAEHYLQLTTSGNELWGSWFACAVIATYGFRKKTYFSFRPHDKVVYIAQWYDLNIRKAV